MRSVRLCEIARGSDSAVVAMAFPFSNRSLKLIV
jgi:hypothetical protein